ncbi:MAG: cysteine--tRNA ligase, partial [Candidatus Omnitrophica bacterium]|nr:cysteine--tRNA ligase [Candidatus Omnitrophota bacterium]
MAVYIYNSLTRKKEEFISLSPPLVNMYSCGPTVYDESHIGHARSFYVFDLIRRYLEFRGYKVKFIRNITDIDDKIIKRSQELNLSWQELVKIYLNRYEEDLSLLNIKRADFEPRATDNISEMIKNIERLIQRGYAYITETGVYFNVDKFASYGKLSHQRKEEMIKGVRIEADEKKKNPLDFALWKISKENEPFWESPWGKGRPGWHIECSTMAMKYLGESLDIHGGGIDLIFPHHENEIAQSESLTGKLFAKYWIHHGLLTIKGQKMAKSLGNFVSIKDVKERYPLDVLKLFFLSAHYSHPIDFSWEKLDEFNRARNHLLSIFDRIDSIGLYDDRTQIINFKDLDELKDEFISSMDDDFN